MGMSIVSNKSRVLASAALNESCVVPRTLLNSLEEMLPSLQDVYRHARSQVALWRLGLVEKGRQLHTQAALFRRTIVNVSASS
jgi:hypothetical protein